MSAKYPGGVALGSDRLPTRIKLASKHIASLQELAADGQALQRFVDTVIQQGQVKARKVQDKIDAIYGELAKEHGIDVKRTQWVLDPSTGELVPVSMQLQP